MSGPRYKDFSGVDKIVAPLSWKGRLLVYFSIVATLIFLGFVFEYRIARIVVAMQETACEQSGH
jgi:hypothetical protein